MPFCARMFFLEIAWLMTHGKIFGEPPPDAVNEALNWMGNNTYPYGYYMRLLNVTRGSRPLSEQDAFCFAAYKMDMWFGAMDKTQLYREVMPSDYQGGLPTVAWTTIYMLPDTYYGTHTVILRPEISLKDLQSHTNNSSQQFLPTRAADTQYIHYHRGVYNPKTAVLVDVGEFETPGYELHSTVMGVIIRDKNVAPLMKSQRVIMRHPPPKPPTVQIVDLYPVSHIILAFLELKFQGESYVLVADGVPTAASKERAFCVDKNELGQWVYCGREFYPYTSHPPLNPTFPILTNQQVRVMGVLKRCRRGEEAQCTLSPTLLAHLTHRSSWSMDTHMQTAIANTQFWDDDNSYVGIFPF
jgi:hypothetical protein